MPRCPCGGDRKSHIFTSHASYAHTLTWPLPLSYPQTQTTTHALLQPLSTPDPSTPPSLHAYAHPPTHLSTPYVKDGSLRFYGGCGLLHARSGVCAQSKDTQRGFGRGGGQVRENARVGNGNAWLRVAHGQRGNRCRSRGHGVSIRDLCVVEGSGVPRRGCHRCAFEFKSRPTARNTTHNGEMHNLRIYH